MKVNAKSYPHPVLANGNDLGGFFKVELPYELGRDTVTLSPSLSLKNSGIEDLLKKERVSFVIEVECRNTFFRRSFSTRKLEEKIAIPSKMLRERVTVTFSICADQNIKEYRPTEPHPDYEGETFSIEAGEVLAVGGQASFIAEKAFDPLRPPISSFMSIMEGSHYEGSMQIDYDTDKITIVLSKDDWKNYLEVRGQAQGILHSAIVFPTLVDAIHKIKTTGTEYEGSNWYGRLNAILEAKGLNDKEAFEAAQKILDNPASRGFEGISSLVNSEDQEEEYE